MLPIGSRDEDERRPVLLEGGRLRERRNPKGRGKEQRVELELNSEDKRSSPDAPGRAKA